jgi:hypothetical protein
MSSVFGGGGKTVNTVQNADPWSGVQPYLSDLFGQSQGLANRTPFGYQASPYTQQAQDLTAQRALDPNSLTGRAQGVLGDTISGKYLNLSTNPALQDALGLAGSAFAKQYGGAAGQNLGNSGYQEALARGLGGVAAQAYNVERQNQLQATQLAPSMDYANLQALGGVGAQQEARAQSQYNSPWSNLQAYQALISGQPGGTTQGQSPYFTNPLASGIGMGLGGLALYNGLGSAGLFGSTAATAGLAGAGAGDIFGTMAGMALV